MHRGLAHYVPATVACFSFLPLPTPWPWHPPFPLPGMLFHPLACQYLLIIAFFASVSPSRRDRSLPRESALQDSCDSYNLLFIPLSHMLHFIVMGAFAIALYNHGFPQYASKSLGTGLTCVVSSPLFPELDTVPGTQWVPKSCKRII